MFLRLRFERFGTIIEKKAEKGVDRFLRGITLPLFQRETLYMGKNSVRQFQRHFTVKALFVTSCLLLFYRVVYPVGVESSARVEMSLLRRPRISGIIFDRATYPAIYQLHLKLRSDSVLKGKHSSWMMFAFKDSPSSPNSFPNSSKTLTRHMYPSTVIYLFASFHVSRSPFASSYVHFSCTTLPFTVLIYNGNFRFLLIAPRNLFYIPYLISYCHYINSLLLYISR